MCCRIFGISYVFTLASTDWAPITYLFIVCGERWGGWGARSGAFSFQTFFPYTLMKSVPEKSRLKKGGGRSSPRWWKRDRVEVGRCKTHTNDSPAVAKCKQPPRGCRSDPTQSHSVPGRWTRRPRRRARQISRHMKRFACLRMRRRRLSSLPSTSLSGVRLGLTSLLGEPRGQVVGRARAGSAGSRDAETGAARGWARERRVRPGGARWQHLTGRPVADPPSLINSEPVPSRCGARFGCGAVERRTGAWSVIVSLAERTVQAHPRCARCNFFDVAESRWQVLISHHNFCWFIYHKLR